MADYKELLRRAVEALPENNGAARRAVYEKARAALVGQLRAINPPLAARDITTHRLQLEDCIRQVEQEASEAMIAGMGAAHEAAPPPIQIEAIVGKGEPVVRVADAAAQKALPPGGSIEDIIAAANKDDESEAQPQGRSKSQPKAVARPDVLDAAEEDEPKKEQEAEESQESDVLPPKSTAQPGARPLPSIVARAEAAKGRSASTAFGLPREKPYEGARRGPTLEPRREARLDPGPRGGQVALARQAMSQPVALQGEPAVAAAMSAVREVDVEPQPSSDPQSDIDRAIATLDREARGEKHPEPVDDSIELDDEDETAFSPGRKGEAGGIFAGVGRQREVAAERRAPLPKGKPVRESRETVQRGRKPREAEHEEPAFPRARAEDRGGMGAVTIFLVVLAVLLVGAGGAGYWAVSQGYLDLGSMFRSSTPQVAEAPAATPAEPEIDQAELATGPGNTATPLTSEPATALEADERLVPEPAPSGSDPLPLVPPGKSEERLADTGAAPDSAEAAVAAIDPATAAGSQSLLLEDSNDANTGAVPFSGTVEWSRGTDETGLPTLLAKANIPARNLGVELLIRKNQDPALPASHLMEINFTLSDGFIGGSIAGLPGVLLKNAELVQGTPLIGPSGVRVVANSFLFALSASPEDAATNIGLMTSRKWMDLFVIYATGKRAILTLEKDEEAQALFAEVFDAWGEIETAPTTDSAG